MSLEIRKRLPRHVDPTCCAGPAPAELARGVAEFNAGQYFEAHETLERLWLAESGDQRLLYQGLLQVGVGLYHLRRGNYRGAINVLGYGLDKLARLPDRCLGIDVISLRAAAAECHARVLALGPDRLADFDWAGVPTVALEP